MFRRSFARAASAVVVSTLLIAAAVAAGPQEKPPPGAKVEKANDPWTTGDPSAAKAKIDQMIDAYDLKPQPLPPIPDDPPPHEGAMIDLPYVIEPPDLIIVEVLEALPGRPISGERLIKPDGAINLGFYGELPVRGLSLAQLKVALIKHLRAYLNDETLGLVEPCYDEGPAGERLPAPDVPKLPENPKNPFDLDEGKPGPVSDRPGQGLRFRKLRTAKGSTIPIRTAQGPGALPQPQPKKAPEPPLAPIVIPFPGQGNVKITIEVQAQGAGAPVLVQPVPPPQPQVEHALQETYRVIPILRSHHVFVDVTAYNSKYYYVLGDVLVPGKIVWTGGETVLDAMQYAQGLIPSADPKNIRLVRPGRGGKPAKVYKIDLEAIQAQGDVRLNYQMFPGDRLIVGRDEVVKKTVELDRLNAPLQTIATSIQQTALAIRYLQFAGPENSDAVLKDIVNFWAKEVSRKGELKLDEQKLRELLLHELKKVPAAPRSAPAPKPR